METIIPQNLIEGANNNSFFDRGPGFSPKLYRLPVSRSSI